MLLKRHQNKKHRKTAKTILIIIAVYLLFCFLSSGLVLAAGSKEDEAKDELQNNINEQLSSIDFAEFQKLLNDLENGTELFGNASFLDKVKSLINGEFDNNYGSFAGYIINVLFDGIIELLPLLATIIAISVLCGLLNSIKHSKSSATSVIYFSCFGAVILCVSFIVFQTVELVRHSVFSMQSQIDAVFPILLTVLAAIGGNASVAAYQPLVAVLSIIVSRLMTTIILPFFIISFVFNIASNLSPNIKLSKFGKWIGSLSKWLIGIVFTIFSAFMAIQGITASVYDGVSIKTAKYAISHYVPLVGGYLSDGFNLVLAGSVVIKNAVGAAALLLLLISVLFTVLKILAVKLCLQLTGAILEPLSEGGFSKFLTDAADSLNILFAIILSVAFMYFISLLLIICTGNHIF